jgi:Fe(3+) dicitrate transport protein
VTPQADAAGQDVDAERAVTYELGTRGYALRRGLFADLTLFLIDFEDRFRPDPAREDVYFNTGKQRHQGVEIFVEADVGRFWRRADGLVVYGAYNYLDTELLEGPYEGNHTRSAPPQKVSWGVRYEHVCGLWGGVDGFWVDESFADEANTRQGSADGMIGIQPSYSLWSARVGYRREFARGRGEVGLEIGATNLGDEVYFYRRPGKGIIPGPDQAWYGALSFGWKF